MSYAIHTGSNLDVLPTLPDNSIDAIVTDPPYELGFMGKSWDSTGIAYNVSLWKECLRVLKPGGHLLAFSGSRTYHRMTCAIEDAGFEVRDQMMWVYGSGFPKSHNISKALDKSACAEREVIGKAYGAGNSNTENLHGLGLKLTYDLTVPATAAAKKWDGWGTALKPAHEPICLARKPLEGTVVDNVRKWGVGGLNIDGCRVSTNPEVDDPRMGGNGTWKSDKMASNVYEGGYAGNEVGSSPKGRFPANLMHDGSQEVLELFPETHAGNRPATRNKGFWSDKPPQDLKQERLEGGSAARFFYCPKASKADRDEGCEGEPDKEWKDDGACIPDRDDRPFKPSKNNHPTVKPTELMRYLCRLITPPGGTILDPFNGSGSTGKAAVLEGFNYIGIEMNPEYVSISEARIKAAIKR